MAAHTVWIGSIDSLLTSLYSEDNKDGTTTLKFPELNETYTFQGMAQAPVRRDLTELQKRAKSQCWSNNDLNHQGVDRGIQAFRDLFNQNPGKQGYLGTRYDIAYFGYNFDGVYTYFCYNDNSPFATGDGYDQADLTYAVITMDRECGAYKPGYYPWNSPSLWGKCDSGTRVCVHGV